MKPKKGDSKQPFFYKPLKEYPTPFHSPIKRHTQALLNILPNLISLIQRVGIKVSWEGVDLKIMTSGGGFLLEPIKLYPVEEVNHGEAKRR